MFKNSLQLLALLFFILIFSTCKKSSIDSPSGGVVGKPPVVEYVTASISGMVIDAGNKPLANAVVNTEFGSTTSDINGYFIFANLKFDKNAAFVIASKKGYFNASKTIFLKAGTANYIQLKMLNQVLAGQFTAGLGGAIAFGNGGSLNFPANIIVNKQTLSPYSGLVSVAVNFVDPASANFGEIMPGSLMGIAKDSSLKALQSYGMADVIMTGSSGEALQIATGKSATISFPVAAAFVANAPSSIPLWYFDEVKGLWREQGVANLQAGKYVGAVSHFSFWNCDYPLPLIDFQLQIKDLSNNPLQGFKVVIRYDPDSIFLYGQSYTNDSGLVLGKIPAGKNLQVFVYAACGSLVYTKKITTGTATLDLGVYTIDPQTFNLVFSGLVKDCAGSPIPNGRVAVLLDGSISSSNIVNGIFSLNVSRCSNTPATAQIVATDLNSNQVGSTTISNVVNSNYSGIQLSSCATSAQFITYTVDTNLINYQFPPDTFHVVTARGGFSLFATQKSTGQPLYLYVSDSTVNINQNVTLFISRYDPVLTCNLSIFEPVGGYISGTFTGNAYDSILNKTVPMQGAFNIKR